MARLWPSIITSCVWAKKATAKIHQACYDTAAFIADEIEKLGVFDIVYNGRGGIPAVSWSLKEGSNPGFNCYDLSDKLRSRGWQVPAYSMPAHREDLVLMRILVRHGVSRDLGSLLIEDMKRCLDYFEKNPVSNSLGAEYGGYSHSSAK